VSTRNPLEVHLRRQVNPPDPTGGDFLPLPKEEILPVKQVALVHRRHPILHVYWEGKTQFSTQLAESRNLHFIGKKEFENGPTVPSR